MTLVFSNGNAIIKTKNVNILFQEDTMKRRFVFMLFLLGLVLLINACDKSTTTTTQSTTSLTTTITQSTSSIALTSVTITEPTTFQVVFDTNGGNIISPVNAEKGYPLLLPLPTREGYQFLGWFVYEDPFYYEFTLLNPVVSDMTLHAKWEVVKYSLVFETSGGESISTLFIDFNTNLDLPEAFKTGNSFEGWYLDENFNTSFNLVTMPSHSVTVYAKWSKLSYLLSLNYHYPLDMRSSIKVIHMGYNHAFAVNNQNHIYAWGINAYGQLGDGTDINRRNPVDITSNFVFNDYEEVVKIETGSSFTMFLTNQSRLFGCGDNSYYQLTMKDGNFSIDIVDITPNLSLAENETISDFSVGNGFIVLLTSNGRVLTWGSNFNSELGNGTSVNNPVVNDITTNFNLNPDEKVISINVGNSHSIAYTSLKRVFTWGFNGDGAIGDGTTTNRSLPSDISSSFSFASGEEVTQMALGDVYCLIMTNQNHFYAWGSNFYGNFGNGNNFNSLVPITVSPVFNLAIGETITKIYGGWNHTMALSSNNRVFIWGDNYFRQLGIGNTVDSNKPIDITDNIDQILGNPVVDLSSKGNASMTISASGRIVTWGDSSNYLLADDDIEDYHRPKYYEIEVLTVPYESLLNDPYQVDGYLFDGWYTDDEYLNKYYELLTPAYDLTLYGKFLEDD